MFAWLNLCAVEFMLAAAAKPREESRVCLSKIFVSIP